jgi:hypothetical protein
VAVAAIDGVTGELKQSRLMPGHDHIRSWIEQLDGPVAVAYEAGPTGFGLYRSLTAAGVRCVVAAPSKLQRPAGDRVKTDAKDAVHLARLLRLGEVTAVAVPSVDQEAARDLVRAREDCRGDLMRARHRLSKLLLRQGIVYSEGNAWTGAHDRWLRQQRFANPVTTMTFETPPRMTAGGVSCFVVAPVVEVLRLPGACLMPRSRTSSEVAWNSEPFSVWIVSTGAAASHDIVQELDGGLPIVFGVAGSTRSRVQSSMGV